MTQATAPHQGADPFAALPPSDTSVYLAGSAQTLAISPIRLGELGAFAKACAPLIAAMKDSPSSVQSAEWVAIMASHSDKIIDALAVATRTPAPQLAALDLSDSITLIEAVIACNADFFTRQVLPKVQGATHRLSLLGNTLQTPSPT